MARLTAVKGGSKKRGSKAGVKRGPYKKNKKGEGDEKLGADDQEPLGKFRRGAEETGDRETTDEDQIGDTVQKRLPGQERPYSKKVEKQALKLYAAQSERLKWAEKEAEERTELERLMEEEEIPEQDLPGGLIAELTKEEKVKALVHKKKD